MYPLNYNTWDENNIKFIAEAKTVFPIAGMTLLTRKEAVFAEIKQDVPDEELTFVKKEKLRA